MTGFTALTHEDHDATIGVTIRAVNHRFLDLQLRLPSSLTALEPGVRRIVQGRLARGHVEVTITLQLRSVPAPVVELNEEFVKALSDAIAHARARGLIDGLLTPGDLLRLPQAMTIRDRQAKEGSDDVARFAASVDAVVAQAVDDLDVMRVREGRHLQNDFDARHRLLGDVIERVQAAADLGRADAEARLRDRVAEMARDLPTDYAMIGQEIVRVAARADITEEVTRFRAHLFHWTALTDGEEPCGRKLDFLLQEMNREISTIGSKANGPRFSDLILTAKAEVEKLREQVQNVE
jgi:uncharacterized protein (TIGR00255 family)